MKYSPKVEETISSNEAMKRRAGLLLSLSIALAPLAATSTARADEFVLTTTPTSDGARRYSAAPVLGFDPVQETAKLAAQPNRPNPLRTSAPKNIVANEDKPVLLIACAIVGVVFLVAVAFH
jgi:hypothetical protein